MNISQNTVSRNMKSWDTCLEMERAEAEWVPSCSYRKLHSPNLRWKASQEDCNMLREGSDSSEFPFPRWLENTTKWHMPCYWVPWHHPLGTSSSTAFWTWCHSCFQDGALNGEEPGMTVFNPKEMALLWRWVCQSSLCGLDISPTSFSIALLVQSTPAKSASLL